MTFEQSDNAFKAALTEGRRLVGIWSSLCSPIAADIIAGSSFDWALLDMEHAPNDLGDIVAQLRCYEGSSVAPIVRPPWNDQVVFKRLLDGGVRNLLVPFVQTADDARRAVAATRYPPEGVRGLTVSGRATGYGRRLEELADSADRICVVVQVETAEALANLEDIARVPGVDAVFVGPSDLSASMGFLGNPEAREVQDAIRDAVSRLKALNVPAGILATLDNAERYADWGFTMISVGSDIGFLRAGIDRAASFGA